ncbi:AMP-binding protein [Prosthecobacter dejongeii]|uniref:Phenylacetate-CoA ligase n=1 Tax=Prosthecobacter dejongeii TaxID=48465 RepID=A0A7W7YJB9_9BACT|nr:phenylacetate-CoA ligase [Prosthecobacter dejongeii]
MSSPIDRDRLRSNQWRKLRSILVSVNGAGGFYANKFQAAKVVVSSMDGVEDFIQQVPFTLKEELLADRLAHPPFGTHLTQPLESYTRFCQTSGTSSGQPVAWLDTPESWEAMLKCWRHVYDGADLAAGKDRIFFAFSFGPFLGFWTAYEAANGHYLTLPSGGLSSQARLEMMARYGATVLCCTPTYALRLGEMIGEASGVEHLSLRVQKIIVAGEPGGSIPEVRARIEKLWNARVYDHHGMTEVGPVSYETTAVPGQLVVIEEAYLAEVIDPATGLEVNEGECGELVLTTLDRTAGPLLRYRTGDWVKKRLWQGRLALEGGVLSRVDDMVVVRGVNVYPSAVEAVVRQFSEIVEFMVEQRKVDAMDEIELLIEVPGNVSKALIKRLEAKLRDTFSMRIPVRLVEADSLPRHEFKAKRWRKV